jgi:hypothetical protein
MRPRKSGSHRTRRWRKADSNRWSHVSYDGDAFQNTYSASPGCTAPEEPEERHAQSPTVLAIACRYGAAQDIHPGRFFQALNAKGIEVPGQKPTAVVASYLSHSTRFDNVRGQGYGLTEWQSQTNAPISGTLFGAPKANGAEPLSP